MTPNLSETGKALSEIDTRMQEVKEQLDQLKVQWMVLVQAKISILSQLKLEADASIQYYNQKGTR